MTLIRNEIVFPPFPAPLFTRGFFPSNAGRFRFSPVHVCDLAEAVVRAVESPEVSRRILHIGGPAEVDWKTLLETIAAVTGRRKLMLPVPGPAVIAAASLLERFSFFPASRDELVMLLDGNTCDGGEAAAALGIDFRGFAPEHLSYLRS